MDYGLAVANIGYVHLVFIVGDGRGVDLKRSKRTATNRFLWPNNWAGGVQTCNGHPYGIGYKLHNCDLSQFLWEFDSFIVEEEMLEEKGP